MRIHQAVLAAALTVLPAASGRASEGVFAIQGYSNQQLVHSDGVQTRSFGALGAVANQLRFQQGDLLVVHSGDYSQNGAGAELWRAPLPALLAAQQAGQPLPWQVLDLGDGENPWDVAAHGGGWWVSLLNSGALVWLDSAGVERRRVGGLSAPEGLAVSGDILAVAESGWGYGASVRLLDASTGDMRATVAVGANPQSLAVDGQGRFWCLCSGRSWENVGASLHCFDPQGVALGHWPVAAHPAELVLDLAGQAIWLGDEWEESHVQWAPLDDPSAFQPVAGAPGGALASRSGDVLVAGAYSTQLQTRSFAGDLLGAGPLLPGGAVDLCAVPAADRLEAPAGLSIHPVAGGRLRLDWNQVLGADGYRLESAGPDGVWTSWLDDVAPGTQVETDSPLRSLRVRALRSW